MAGVRRAFGSVGIWVALLLATALTVSVGISSALRDMFPGQALAWAPWDARAKANLAITTLEQGKTQSAQQALLLANASLARDLTYAPAIRARGLAGPLSGHMGSPRALFAASQATLRRDLNAQLWLIEDRVRADDVPGALVHYDMALTTSRLAPPLLFPILVNASAQPGMAKPLADLLSKQRPWARDLLGLLIARPPSPTALVEIVQYLQEMGKPINRDAYTSVIETLVRNGDMDLAWTVYRLARRRPGLDPRQIRDGDFEQANDYPPGDWLEETAPDRKVRREPRPGGGHALYFVARRMKGASIVSEMMQLPPGRYRLAGISGQIPAVDVPFWELACAGETSTLIGKFPISAAPGGAFSGEFVVPPGACRNQTLSLTAPSSAYDSDDEAWIDDIAIVPVG